MNRYEREGITNEIIMGRRIIICGSGVYTRYVFHSIHEHMERQHIGPVKVKRGNGKESIQYGDGHLSFANSPDALRGRQADTVLFSMGIRWKDDFRETWAEVARPIRETSKNYYTDVLSG